MKSNGPWQIKGSTEKYRNPWMRLREDEVVHPNGKDGIYGVVEMMAGVVTLPIDSEGHVYLAREFRYALETYSIEAAGGGIDAGETPLDAAKRELREELGIEATRWVDLWIMNPVTSIVQLSMVMYLAEDFSFSQWQHEDQETIERLRVPLTEAVDMVMRGEITDAASCIVILKAAEYVRKKG